MSNKIPQFIAGLLESLPEMLIEERVRLRLTQRQLAEKIGLKEQQIQRYEASRYQSASLRRLQEVAKALFDLGVSGASNPLSAPGSHPDAPLRESAGLPAD